MVSPSGRVPGRAPEPSRDGFFVDGGCGTTFRGFSRGCLGFSRNEEYMDEEAESGAARAGHTRARRGQRGARTWARCGHPVAHLRFIFWLLESSDEI